MMPQGENMNNKPTIIIAFLITLMFILNAFSEEMTNYPPEIRETLQSAAENRGELENAITYFTSDEDSLKLPALFYLIANMKDHSYVIYYLADSTGKEIDFNIFDYPDYDALRIAWDTLEKQSGKIDFKEKEKKLDTRTITSDYLIAQIEYAFRAWGEKSWAKGLSFKDFCEYILPYRGSNEPLEPWREYFFTKYMDIENRMIDPSDPLEAASLINDDLKSWFKFDPRFYEHPTDQGLSEMLENRLGRCEDMTNLTIYAMRANGLAVTSDYTPYWANTGNNHAWNAIVTPDSKVTPFMGAECNPGCYRLANKMAKVYRKMFSIQRENLAFQAGEQEKLPRYISGKSYIDVTRDYVEVTDVTVELEQGISDSANIAYLCVFNSGEWRAIHWGKISENKVIFTDMGLDIAYLPALYIKENIVPIGDPFILQADSSIRKLKSDGAKTLSARLISTTHRTQEISTDGIAKVFLTPGQGYELFFWQDGWQSLGKQVAGNEPLIFPDVPAGCLYWLVATGSDREERIFTIDEDKQVWW